MHCVKAGYSAKKGSHHKIWDLTLRVEFHSKDPLPKLPGPFESLRRAVLQAREDGGWAVDALTIRPMLEGEAALTLQIDGEDALTVCRERECVLRTANIVSVETMVRIDYALRIIAPPEDAVGFVQLDGSDVRVSVRYARDMQPDMFTTRADLDYEEPSDAPLFDTDTSEQVASLRGYAEQVRGELVKAGRADLFSKAQQAAGIQLDDLGPETSMKRCAALRYELSEARNALASELPAEPGEAPEKPRRGRRSKAAEPATAEA